MSHIKLFVVREQDLLASLSFMKACSNLEVEQVFTSYNNPKGECRYRKNDKNNEGRALLAEGMGE